MITKRLLLIALGIILVVGVALQFTPRVNRRYRAESRVISTPFTNTLFARSFESYIIRTIPGVLALRVTPTFSGRPGSGVPVLTNGVGIRIIAIGPTSEDAQRAANEAATQLCSTVLTNYGVTGEFVDSAKSARRFSYFHDTFQPAVGRLFKR